MHGIQCSKVPHAHPVIASLSSTALSKAQLRVSKLYYISLCSKQKEVQSSPVQDKEQAKPGAWGGCRAVPTGAIADERDSDIFATCSGTKKRERESKGGRKGGREVT